MSPAARYFVAMMALLTLMFWVNFAVVWWAESRMQGRQAPRARRQIGFSVAVFSVLTIVALTGCGDTINPVRYDTVPVLVTKPCLAGRTPPAEAIVLTEPACTGTDAECVRAAKADILELQREVRQYRPIFKECSK